MPALAIRNPFGRRAPRHPTPQQAFEALSAGRCLYEPTGSACSGGVRSTGLRDADDISAVLVCRAHYGRLRQLHGRELDQLERYLVAGFHRPPQPAPSDADERLRVVFVNRRTRARSD
jgi:hypothetical protein